MISRTNKTRKIQQQRGIHVVEFAIVGLVFFIVLFMLIEFGRVLFVWNVLDEITRRGARLAAICPIDGAANSSAPGIFVRSTMGSNPLNVAAGEFIIEYLDSNSDVVADPAANFGAIIFVRARIEGYQLQTVFPMPVFMNAPAFETTLPAESLGVSPLNTGVTTC